MRLYALSNLEITFSHTHTHTHTHMVCAAVHIFMSDRATQASADI